MNVLFSYVLACIIGTLSADTHLHPFIVKTVWGEQTITDSCAQEIIATSLMQRLNGIDQSGPQRYFGIVPSFNRFEHSVGVYLLLVKAGVSHKEQIAGLMHDASHTVFSHLGDMLFGNGDGHKSYQDGIHIDYLNSYPEIKEIVRRYGYQLEDMDPDKEEYTALEQDLPDLCADRIQYIIHTGVLLNYITQDDAKKIVDDLKFENGIWYFNNVASAYIFATISLRCIQSLWGNELNSFFYLLFKHILLRAIELELVTEHDLHYKMDIDILEILNNSSDEYIQRLLTYTSEPQNFYKLVKYEESDIHYKIKFRGVDPLVKTDNESFQRLTEINFSYCAEYQAVKEWCKEGYGLHLLCSL